MIRSFSSSLRRGRRPLAAAGIVVSATLAVFATFASAAFAGNFFATGHDQDLHCAGRDANECAYYEIASNFVRAGSSLPVLILDRGALQAVMALNLAYSNNQSTTPTSSSPPYVVEDPQGLATTQINGAAPPGITTASTWPTTALLDSSGHPLWSAIIVASDASCGGCDLNNTSDGTHPDSDAINARASAIQAFFNAGGGLLYLAGADNAFDADGVSGKDIYYASVPVPIGGQPVTEPFTVTSDGASLGITDAMVNCCATHNSFSLPPAGSTIRVAETDSAGLAESLFVQNGNVCTGGFCGPPPPPPPPPPPAPPPQPPPIAPPALTPAAPTVSGASTAAFSGAVNPSNLVTTAHFEYGIDPAYRGPGSSMGLYNESTPDQPVGADGSIHIVSASVSGLVPNALYHVRLVATNSSGTTFGPDQTFRTGSLPPPGAPTIGRTFNVAPVSGLVLVRINGVFVPLTQLRQITQNAEIDALQGTLQLITAIAGPSGAQDTAAKGTKHKTKVKIQKGTFGGAIFKLNQTTRGVAKGLVTLTLVENAFKGAPSYATCNKHKAGEASAAALSSKTLQLLHANAKGKFTTKGKYGAATVRGTIWTLADRCDGTLTHDITDSVVVNDFVHHKTIILHAGQSYLARKP